jgi:hypothetical protein
MGWVLNERPLGWRVRREEQLLLGQFPSGDSLPVGTSVFMTWSIHQVMSFS